jgi:hypothetical protein
MSSVLFKTEDAIESILSNATGLDTIEGFHRGASNEELKLPFISILAENGEERQPRGIGNYSVTINIELHTSSDDATRDDRITLTNALIAALSIDDLASQLSAAVDDYYVHGLLINSQSQRVSNRSNIYIISARIDCRNADPS